MEEVTRQEETFVYFVDLLGWMSVVLRQYRGQTNPSFGRMKTKTALNSWQVFRIICAYMPKYLVEKTTFCRMNLELLFTRLQTMGRLGTNLDLHLLPMFSAGGKMACQQLWPFQRPESYLLLVMIQ